MAEQLIVLSSRNLCQAPYVYNEIDIDEKLAVTAWLYKIFISMEGLKNLTLTRYIEVNKEHREATSKLITTIFKSHMYHTLS